ncbi:hypothetical protein BH11PLA2_BH11PLA2_23970 [soil metagenome]
MLLISEGRFDRRDLKQLLPKGRPRVSISSDAPTGNPLPLPDLGKKIGQYRLGRILGRGNSTVVFRSTHRELNLPVAVKVAVSTVAVPQMKSETVALSAINHKNVIRLWDAMPNAIVLERARFSVKQLLTKRGSLAPATVFVIARSVIRGLNAAHQAGFLHDDIKPGNLLVTADGVVKVADFGLARRFEDHRESDQVTGSWAYLAPECFHGQGDHRADIYSLGLTLHQMLTGIAPVSATTFAEARTAHSTLNLEPLHWTVPGVSRAAARLVKQMTSRHPDDRPDDYNELLAGFARL